MEKIFLLPNGFKKVGWIILVPTFVLGVLMTIDGYNGFPSFLLPEWIPLAMKRVLLETTRETSILFDLEKY